MKFLVVQLNFKPKSNSNQMKTPSSLQLNRQKLIKKLMRRPHLGNKKNCTEDKFKITLETCNQISMIFFFFFFFSSVFMLGFAQCDRNH